MWVIKCQPSTLGAFGLQISLWRLLELLLLIFFFSPRISCLFQAGQIPAQVIALCPKGPINSSIHSIQWLHMDGEQLPLASRTSQQSMQHFPCTIRPQQAPFAQMAAVGPSGCSIPQMALVPEARYLYHSPPCPAGCFAHWGSGIRSWGLVAFCPGLTQHVVQNA